MVRGGAPNNPRQGAHPLTTPSKRKRFKIRRKSKNLADKGIGATQKSLKIKNFKKKNYVLYLS